MEASWRMPTASMNARLEVSDDRIVNLDSDDDELKQIRRARIAQILQEQSWRDAGQGSLRELGDEVEFLDVLQPRERGVCLVCDGATERFAEILDLLEVLAKKYLGTQFCHLELENAGVLADAMDLENGIPVVFVVKHGKVVSSLSPAKLFERGPSGSPKFRRHFLSLLRASGGIDRGGAPDSDSDLLSEPGEDYPALD
mmetsp:Transcript_38852/g.77056  ORF Transcript_38852/g.77056 Transcript_38852/m.77056 type:complete len:199 (+) Transcript_38852:78-674(+)